MCNHRRLIEALRRSCHSQCKCSKLNVKIQAWYSTTEKGRRGILMTYFCHCCGELVLRGRWKLLNFQVWPKQLRERLKVTADDPDLINEIVSKIFRYVFVHVIQAPLNLKTCQVLPPSPPAVWLGLWAVHGGTIRCPPHKLGKHGRGAYSKTVASKGGGGAAPWVVLIKIQGTAR